MVMNMGISGSKVFSFLLPDENLSETLDFFTYLAPRRSAVGGKGGLCGDKQQQDAGRRQGFARSLSPPDPSVAMNNK